MKEITIFVISRRILDSEKKQYLKFSYIFLSFLEKKTIWKNYFCSLFFINLVFFSPYFQKKNYMNYRDGHSKGQGTTFHISSFFRALLSRYKGDWVSG